VYAVVPPKTEYRLTRLGERVHEPVALLCEWALEHQEVLDEVDARSGASSGSPAN